MPGRRAGARPAGPQGPVDRPQPGGGARAAARRPARAATGSIRPPCSTRPASSSRSGSNGSTASRAMASSSATRRTAQDIFVHMETVRRGGLADLSPDQPLRARIAVGPQGPARGRGGAELIPPLPAREGPGVGTREARSPVAAIRILGPFERSDTYRHDRPPRPSPPHRPRPRPAHARYEAGAHSLARILSRYRPKFTRQLPIGPYIADLACRPGQARRRDRRQPAYRLTPHDEARTRSPRSRRLGP